MNNISKHSELLLMLQQFENEFLVESQYIPTSSDEVWEQNKRLIDIKKFILNIIKQLDAYEIR
jgi:hypothetical protein